MESIYALLCYLLCVCARAEDEYNQVLYFNTLYSSFLDNNNNNKWIRLHMRGSLYLFSSSANHAVKKHDSWARLEFQRTKHACRFRLWIFLYFFIFSYSTLIPSHSPLQITITVRLLAPAGILYYKLTSRPQQQISLQEDSSGKHNNKSTFQQHANWSPSSQFVVLEAPHTCCMSCIPEKGISIKSTRKQ